MDPRDNDVTVELPISTLSRILKVTQFHKQVYIVCEPNLPVCLSAQLGVHGSRADVFIHHDASLQG